MVPYLDLCFFFFNDTATTEIYTLSLHDALPICSEADPFGAQTSEPTSPTCEELGVYFWAPNNSLVQFIDILWLQCPMSHSICLVFFSFSGQEKLASKKHLSIKNHCYNDFYIYLCHFICMHNVGPMNSDSMILHLNIGKEPHTHNLHLLT